MTLQQQNVPRSIVKEPLATCCTVHPSHIKLYRDGAVFLLKRVTARSQEIMQQHRTKHVRGSMSSRRISCKPLLQLSFNKHLVLGYAVKLGGKDEGLLFGFLQGAALGHQFLTELWFC